MPRPKLPTLADRLRRLREAAGLSQADLAGQLGISRQAYWKIESGACGPRWQTVQRLAVALGVDLDELKT
jgi:putative transcriptional regulator